MTLPALGIDIAKCKFDVALFRAGKLRHKVLPNNPAGFHQLGQWLAHLGIDRVHACMEATAGYGDDLALLLHQAGHTVSIVNPARIKGYAQSMLTRNKTDKMDAVVIARFCEAQHPEAWSPNSPQINKLQALMRRLSALEQMKQQESNRLAMTNSKEVISSINTMIEFLGREIQSIKRLIGEHIEADSNLKRDYQLLVSIPGIGNKTACWLLAEVDFRSYSSARQVAAHAGLTPEHHQSGSSIKGKTGLSKMGNARLRKSLYLPAVVAKNHNPIIKVFCERLSGRGKCKMVIIGAAMRKLVHLAYGVLKSGRPFDPNYATAS